MRIEAKLVDRGGSSDAGVFRVGETVSSLSPIFGGFEIWSWWFGPEDLLVGSFSDLREGMSIGSFQHLKSSEIGMGRAPFLVPSRQPEIHNEFTSH